MSLPEILDANLGRLLRRAYVPVRPAPAFRARLRETFLEEHARRCGSRAPGPRPSPPLRRRPLAWVAAAAALAGLLAAGVAFLGGDTTGPGLEGIHGGGRVAVRTDPEGAWRGLGKDAEPLAVVEPWLEVATPPTRSLAMLLGKERITARPDTRVILEERPELCIVNLEQGGLHLAQSEEDALWIVDTAHGSLEMGAARLSLSDEGAAVRLRLEEGRAWVVAAAGSEDLPVGRDVLLVDGHVRDPAAATGGIEGAPARGGRVAVTPAPPDAPPPDPNATPAGAVVRGRVRVEGEEEPVTSFTVAVLRERADNAYYEPAIHEFQSPDGTFELTVPPQRARIFVHAFGLALWRTPVRDLAAGDEVELDVRLGLGGEVRGLLLDPASGNPVPAAWVVSDRDAVSVGVPLDLERWPVWLPVAARSSADGSFVLPHLSPGEHVLRVTAPGFAPRWTDPIRVEEGAAISLPALELREGAAVEGTVTAPDGTPAPQRRIILTRLGAPDGGRDFGMTLTDLQGHFRVEDLPPGLLLAILLLDETGTEPPLVRPFTASAGATARIAFRLEPPGTRLLGVLRDAEGAPVGGRNLALVPTGARAEAEDAGFVATATNAEGAYAFEGVTPGPYAILAIMDRSGDERLLVDEIDVPDQPEVRRDLTLARGRIEGRIRDFVTGESVAPCTVTLLRPRPGRDPEQVGQVRVDGEGRYAFPHVPPGTYRVVASPSAASLGFEESEDLVLDETDPLRTCDLALHAGGSARVLARDEGGRPLRGVFLVFERGDGLPFVRDEYFATDAEGAFLLPGLRPGPYRVRGELPGHRTVTREFICRVGLETEVPIVLPEKH